MGNKRQKPVSTTVTYYDYLDVMDFIDKKYNIGETIDRFTDYLERECYFRNNGDFFTIDITSMPRDNAVIGELVKLLIEEFGDSIVFRIEW